MSDGFQLPDDLGLPDEKLDELCAQYPDAEVAAALKRFPFPVKESRYLFNTVFTLRAAGYTDQEIPELVERTFHGEPLNSIQGIYELPANVEFKEAAMQLVRAMVQYLARTEGGSSDVVAPPTDDRFAPKSFDVSLSNEDLNP